MLEAVRLSFPTSPDRRTLNFSFISPNDKDFEVFPYKLHHISTRAGVSWKLLVILTMIYGR